VHEAYEYREIRVARGKWPAVVQDAPRIAGELASAGGLLIGIFAAEIGAPASDGIVLTANATWPAGLEIPDTQTLRVDQLDATVRPTEPPTDLDHSGIYAHRWFDLGEADWREFVALSEGAWPHFEGINEGTRVIGFFRDRGAAAGKARVLLLTRYPSLAAWELSRTYEATAREGADPASYGAARQAFGRRAQLTESTIVRTYRLRA
jgi:hypothetical protein